LRNPLRTTKGPGSPRLGNGIVHSKLADFGGRRLTAHPKRTPPKVIAYGPRACPTSQSNSSTTHQQPDDLETQPSHEGGGGDCEHPGPHDIGGQSPAHRFQAARMCSFTCGVSMCGITLWPGEWSRDW